jgi:signal transduction histidine kinase
MYKPWNRASARYLLVLGIVMSGGFQPSVAQNDKPTDSKKNVLILYGERLDLPAIRIAEQNLREFFAASTTPQVEWFAEYFDFARFPTTEHEANLARYLRERYAGRKIDLIMPVSSLSLRFLLRHREEIFPGVPVVYAVQSAAEIDVGALPPDVTGVAAETDVRGTVDLALRLQPETREIVCVSGASEADQGALAQATKVLEGYRDRLRVRVVSGRSLSQTIEEVRGVSRGQIVLLISFIRDAEGRALSTREVARQLSAVSQAPIYGLWGTLLDTGVVGGALIDIAAVARKAAEVALKVLGGVHVAVGSPETKSRTPLVVDWRALQHWKLPVSRVPAEAVVMFRQPTLWEEHRQLIIGIATVMVVQTSLIVGLLAQRVWRRRLEREAAELRHELTHAGRVTMLGQLASSLAHELNQPLGAILRNAEAAELFLQSDKPDLDELRAIVADIRKDDQRAGDVIDRLRALLKRRQLDPRPVLLNELVDEVVTLMRADSMTRRVGVEIDVPRDLPLVRGDRIHLQQVLLNLLLNGMDALADVADGERSLTVRARTAGVGFVELAVTDNGHGIPTEKLGRLFEPFFTTKPQGMGLGLPISRTIVEAHGGRIWAENNAERGATFRFTLPFAKGGAA